MTTPKELYYNSQGESGPPLLVLHGLYGSSANWSSHARWMAERFRVILPDMRNHGRSPHDPDMSYLAMAADLKALLDRLAIPQAIVLGHSMGGKAAMTLALQHPERVRALIVADIAPVTYRHDHGDIIGAMRSIDLDAVTSREAVDNALAWVVREPMVRQFLLTNLQRRAGAFQWRIPLSILNDQLPLIEGFPEFAEPYEGPALFIYGGASDYVTHEAETPIRRFFPNAEMEVIEGAGHWLHVEQPGPFAEHVKAYLARF